jgi:hypothetical protein
MDYRQKLIIINSDPAGTACTIQAFEGTMPSSASNGLRTLTETQSAAVEHPCDQVGRVAVFIPDGLKQQLRLRGVGQKRSMAPVKKPGIGSLIYEPAVVLFGRASLIMRNLRTKKREDSGKGYTNQATGGQCE